MFRKIQTIDDSFKVTRSDWVELINSINNMTYPDKLYWEMSDDAKKFFKKERHNFQHKDKKKRGGKYRRLIS